MWYKLILVFLIITSLLTKAGKRAKYASTRAGITSR